LLFFFFFNDTATTEIYTLSLHDALPISAGPVSGWWLPISTVVFVTPGVEDPPPPQLATAVAVAAHTATASTLRVLIRIITLLLVS